MTSARTNGHRSVHLVGTVPALDAGEAFQLFASTLGDHLPTWVPDGETGARQDWVQRIIDGLRSHPDLQLVRDGDWSDYDKTPYFAPSREFSSLELDYSGYFEETWPDFESFRAEKGEHLLLQIGIPTQIDLALIAFGFKPVPGLRHMAPFRDATVREITRIHAVAGEDAVFQLEMPIPLILLGRMPAPLRVLVAGRLAGELVKVPRRSPPGTRFGLHLCYGDMNHRSMADPDDSGPAVQLANAIMSAWPPDQTLEFVHVPFALGEKPPPLDHAFYRPLDRLRLGAHVRFAAGLVHEGRTVPEMVQLLRWVEELLGRTVDVGAACGLGRRDRPRAETNLRLSAELAAV